MQPAIQSSTRDERRLSRSLCPVCGGLPKPLPGICPNAWLCPDCDHTFISELPTEKKIGELYETYSYEAVDLEELPSFLDVIQLDLLKSFERFRTSGRFLDVGFGHGGFLRVAKKAGWDTHGVELSSAAIRAGNRLGLGTLHEGDFRTLPLEKGSYDVVVMSEVIEHLPDPMSFLRRAAEVVRPGGLLYMTTPHGRGLSGRSLRASWSVLCPPDHLQLYSIESMRRSLLEAGFSKPGVYTQGILPHELVTHLRARLPLRREAKKPASVLRDEVATQRLDTSYSLNEKMMKGVIGRATKKTANALLRLSRLGDSLRVRAIR